MIYGSATMKDRAANIQEGSFVVVATDAHIGHHGRVKSEPIEIDEQRPIQSLDLCMPEGINAPILVLSPKGEPIP